VRDTQGVRPVSRNFVSRSQPLLRAVPSLSFLRNTSPHAALRALTAAWLLHDGVPEKRLTALVPGLTVSAVDPNDGSLNGFAGLSPQTRGLLKTLRQLSDDGRESLFSYGDADKLHRALNANQVRLARGGAPDLYASAQAQPSTTEGQSSTS
jgi:hypothetical protein